MRFLHISDLHFGKSIHGVSLLESGDQPYWAERFTALCREIRPDAVLIAGDVYDRSSPSAEAVALLDRMLTSLCEMGVPVLLIAGNHDSGQRLAFAEKLLSKQRLYMAGVLREGGRIDHVTFSDEFGPVTFWLLPYVYPALIAHVLQEEAPRDYDAAVRQILSRQEIDRTERHVLVAHQNVTAFGKEAERGGSESMVGGVGQIDYSAFDAFDYAALGHIHAAYPVGRDTVRYAGSPLCYHFRETRQPAKGPLLVTMGEKGTAPVIETLCIPPLHPMQELKGTLASMRERMLLDAPENAYLRIVLDDTRITPEITDFFQRVCEAHDTLLMEIVSEHRAYAPAGEAVSAADLRSCPVEEMFASFYTDRMGGQELSEEDAGLLRFAGELLHERDDGRGGDKADRLLAFLREQEERI